MTAKERNAKYTAELATILGCKPQFILTRLKAVELADTCTRCGGSGQYSYCQMYGTTCFKCSGSGVQMPRLTAALVVKAKEAVTAGKMQPYLDMLAARAEAKRIGDRLLDDYASLTTKEKALTGDKKFWAIGTAEGFAIRSAAHPFYEAAAQANRGLPHAKTDAERVKLAATVKRMHAAMMESPARFVPVGIDGDTVINTLKLLPEAEKAHNELSRRIASEARAAVKAILAEIEAGE